MGAIVGITFAIITLIVIGDIFTKRDAFWDNVKCKLPRGKHANGTRNEARVNILTKIFIRKIVILSKKKIEICQLISET